MVESAQAQEVAPERIGLLDAARWLIGAEGEADVADLLVNPARIGRAGPRVVNQGRSILLSEEIPDSPRKPATFANLEDPVSQGRPG